MKKTFRSIINGIVTAFILLTLFVSCGNLDNEKLASIVISFGNARSEIPYQKSDVSYYIAIITPDPNKEGEVKIDNQKTSHEFAELPSGKYSLNVYAYNEKDILVAEGSDEEIEVNPGETAQAHVTMKLKAYHVHDFAEEWTCDETHHWHAATCGDTDEVQDKAEHTFGEWITVIAATEETGGLRKQTCKICNYEKTEKIPLLNHTHTWATEWSYDENNHWHAATCGDTDEVQDKAEHIFGEWITVTAATEENEGLKKRTCTVCNYEETETIPLLNHTHTWATEWSYDENKHWHKCTSASCTERAQDEEHVWSEGVVTIPPTCTVDGEKTFTCTICYATKTEVIPATGHNPGTNTVTINTEPTCFTDGERQYICEYCGETITEPIPALGWCETPIDAETFMPATKSSSLVYFGVFPQTVLPSASNVTVDENESVAIGTQTYYKGSDGEYYVKTDVVPFQQIYKYKDGTTVSSEIRYFRMEPLKWIVLATDYDVDGTNGGKTAALLLANNVLTAGSEVVWYEHYNINHDTTGNPSNYYEDSQARAYLNGIKYDAAASAYYQQCQSSDDKWYEKGFLQQAFTDSAKEKIKVTSVDNSKNVRTTGEPTNDKIFLLSISEYNDYKDKILNHYVSDYALAKGQCLNAEWWSRSSDSSSVYRFIDNEKTPSTNNVFPIQKEIGMCPALCIDLPDAN